MSPGRRVRGFFLRSDCKAVVEAGRLALREGAFATPFKHCFQERSPVADSPRPRGAARSAHVSIPDLFAHPGFPGPRAAEFLAFFYRAAHCSDRGSLLDVSPPRRNQSSLRRSVSSADPTAHSILSAFGTFRYDRRANSTRLYSSDCSGNRSYL